MKLWQTHLPIWKGIKLETWKCSALETRIWSTRQGTCLSLSSKDCDKSDPTDVFRACIWISKRQEVTVMTACCGGSVVWGWVFFFTFWLMEERSHFSGTSWPSSQSGLCSPLSAPGLIWGIGLPPLWPSTVFLEASPWGYVWRSELELLHGGFAVFFMTAVKPIRILLDNWQLQRGNSSAISSVREVQISVKLRFQLFNKW